MNKPSLKIYVISVIIVWALVLSTAWLTGGITRLNTFALVCSGFLLGMLAMYIARHFYK